eukprot:GHVU01006146.1.p1 GENE.GHVU01006146.1~~GHVU01006146.1.p1  ORF type:complete len:172 (-),score=2.31 GHVU01006146.1:1033-1548(-)
MRNNITDDACQKAVQSLVISRIDYCNTLLAGLSKTQLRRLQLVQNRAARLILLTPLRDPITPVLYKLHWLPVDRRIEFKMLVYAYKALHGCAPAYLSSTISIYRAVCALRSGAMMQLVEQRNSKGVGLKAFSVAVPKHWNKLPMVLRDAASLNIFKKQLKTHLFAIHYSHM